MGAVPRPAPLINMGHPLVQAARRVLFTVLGVQLVLALSLTLVDSWRRRGKKSTAVPDHAAALGHDR